MKLNPGIRRAEPEYDFCEYPDGEYQEHDIQIRHNQAVTARGVEKASVENWLTEIQHPVR